jgi:hypothetical protein
VDVGVAEPGPVLGDRSSELLVAAAVGHAGELLDVDVDQFAAAAGLDAADHPAGRPVHPTQLVHSMADQHPVHRRRWHPDDP